MNTPTTVAPVRDAIPIRPTRRLQGSAHLIRPALAATFLCLCLLPLGEARAVADTSPRVAPITSVGGVMGVSTDTESRDEAKALMESDCVAQVRQSTGEQGEITVGDPRSVYTWASGFLDGSQPSAQPVDTGDWAATVSSGGKPVGLLEVVHDKGHATCTPVFDDDLATDVDQMGEAHLVHDRNANAWYSLSGTTVTAMGEAATRRLAGPIELRDYGEVLRERAGSKPKTSAGQSEERSTTGGWTIWGPVLAVVVVGLVTVVITVRHERKVTAPLRQARNRADMAEGDADTTAGETLGDTIPESRVNSPRDPRA